VRWKRELDNPGRLRRTAGAWYESLHLPAVDWRRQRDAVLRMMLIPLAPAALLLAVTYLQTAVPVRDLLRDTNAALGVPFYVGVISDLGLLLWGAAAAVCFFTWILLSDVRGGEWRGFLLASGIFSVVLLSDDWLQLHEVVFPDYLGVPEPLVYMAYVLAMLAYLFTFRKTILKTEFSLLAIALALFALSIVLDQFSEIDSLPSFRGIGAVEDGAKLMGILAWLTYFVRTCKGIVTRRVSPPTT
jgi:hypothetical protein